MPLATNTQQTTDVEQLLRELRTIFEPHPIDVLGVGAVDRLLELFRYRRPATPSHRPGWAATDDDNDDAGVFADLTDGPETASAAVKKSRPPVLEIASSRSGAGKTTFLYLLAAHALLPSAYGGKASAVIWVDSDGRFSALRLAQVVRHLLPKDASTEALVQAAVSHLHILTPYTSSQLLPNLQSLPDELLRLKSDQPLSLLVLDSATAFAQQDRFDAEMARLEAGADFSASPRTPTRTTQIIAALRTIQQQFECTILVSTSTTSPSYPPTTTTGRGRPRPRHPGTPGTRERPDEPAALSPWTSFATLTLTIGRSPVTQFAPGATLEECLRDREKRQEAVAAGKFAVGPDWAGSERWPPGVREAVERLEGRGRFEMRITGEGVELG